ncbi:uncharacterized protein MELLADRAFT_108766 [Melampsora larici-populina 98AG31]|uniref:Uncharacterized protein n=1 Tax=Melampsora larici-populina (strain 98AG31 / pathotype 3-4-7) TaxID=747676 RepID=F4RU66_MELLP|nr:uncharacterized protein MELLADRAFT_108766 [Melampsora larici-populina 98AG31]EGG04125.1 hypothetical protein MELLADRAFT_108766 [Melampsora larici-populina 98AG31]
MRSNPNQFTKLTPQEVTQYLNRLNLTHSQLPSCSIETLKLLHLNHLLYIPFDTTSLQLPKNWWKSNQNHDDKNENGKEDGKEKEKVWVNPMKKEFEGVFLDEVESFNRIIIEGRGGYCFNLNYLFARLLITLNYEVTLQGARVNMYRNSNPSTHGHLWSPITHLTLFVTIPSSPRKFLCDIGFGGGSSAFPIELIPDIPIKTLTKGEEFKLNFQLCPDLENENGNEGQKAWTVERFVNGYWSACYHVYLNPLTVSDLEVYNWYNSTCPAAHFKSFMVVSILKPNGSRRTLTATTNPEGTHDQIIKLYTKENVISEESDVSIIEPNFNTFYETLCKEFGWGIQLDRR